MEIDLVDAAPRSGGLDPGGDGDDERRPLVLEGRRQFGFTAFFAGGDGRAAPSLRDKRGGLGIVSGAGLIGCGAGLGEPLGARCQCRQLGGEAAGQSGQIDHGHRVFAGCGAQREQPLFCPFEIVGVEGDRRQGLVQRHFGIAQRRQSAIEGSHHRVEQAARFPGAALQTAQQAAKLRRRRRPAGDDLVRLGDLGREFFRAHHEGALLGQRRFFVGLRIEGGEFRHRGAEVGALRLGGRNSDAQPGRIRGCILPGSVWQREGSLAGGQVAVRIEGAALAGHKVPRAVVVLAMNLDERGADACVTARLKPADR